MSWMAREFGAWETSNSARFLRSRRIRSVLVRITIPSLTSSVHEAVTVALSPRTFSTMHNLQAPMSANVGT